MDSENTASPQPVTSLWYALVLLLLLGNTPALALEERLLPWVSSDGETELTLTIMPPAKERQAEPKLIIWLQELTDDRPALDEIFAGLQAEGFTVWRTHLLEALFLERTPDNVRKLDGSGVEILMQAAEQWAKDNSGKDHTARYMFFAAERMAIPALRGIRDSFRNQTAGQHFGGIVLTYPNLYSHNPMAGTEPDFLPVADQVGFPITLFQPEHDPRMYRLPELLGQLESQGAPVFVRLIRNVRHYYFLHHPGENPYEDQERAKMPGYLSQSLKLMSALLDTERAHQAAKRKSNHVALSPQETSKLRGLIPFPGHPVGPDFTLLASTGDAMKLSDTRGKVVLVNFWATWCPPCVHEIPSMNRLVEQYQGKDFELVSINYMEEPNHIQQFLRSVNVDFPVLLDPQGTASHGWKVFAFPSSFLLDREGRIRYSVNSAIDWDEPGAMALIDALLKEPADTKHTTHTSQTDQEDEEHG